MGVEQASESGILTRYNRRERNPGRLLMKITKLKCSYYKKYQAKIKPRCGCLKCALKWTNK